MSGSPADSLERQRVDAPPSPHGPERLADLEEAPEQADSVRFGADLRAVRAHARDWAVTQDLPVRIRDDLILAVDELAANSVRHGGGHGTLRLWADMEGVVAEVADQGWIRDPDAGARLPAVDQPDGRGLWIANALAEQLQIVTGPDGTVVRARFARG